MGGYLALVGVTFYLGLICSLPGAAGKDSGPGLGSFCDLPCSLHPSPPHWAQFPV